MDRRDWITISVVAVLAAVALVTISVLTLLRAPVWIEFVVAMGMFFTILIGAYLSVITPQKQREEERDTD